MNLDVLTPRERSVVTSLRMGVALKVVALELCIDPSTVSMHASSAVRKLGLAGRLALVHGGALAPCGEIPRFDGLAQAEREVAGLAVLGLSNAEIGARRGTSLRTVANQLARVYRKLGVGSRAELAVVAREDG
jgi:DNA-binding NarL/FixJ family response regulator